MSNEFVDIKEWIFFCVDCNKEFYKASNGAMVQASAEMHHKKTDHYCLVGYSVKLKENTSLTDET